MHMIRSKSLGAPLLVGMIVTGIALPLMMLLASAPSGDDAAAGFNQVNYSVGDFATWLALALAIFVLTFAVALIVLRLVRPRFVR